MGRPSVVTPEVIRSLKQAYLIGATHDEAAHYAGIAPSTLYLHMEKNPEFSEQISGWKNEPILKAKRKVVTDIEKDTNTAKWYLERKSPDFKNKTELDVSVSPQEKILEAYGLTKDGKISDDLVKDAEMIVAKMEGEDGNNDEAATAAPQDQA